LIKLKRIVKPKVKRSKVRVNKQLLILATASMKVKWFEFNQPNLVNHIKKTLTKKVEQIDEYY
jgi:hypothetical protein